MNSSGFVQPVEKSFTRRKLAFLPVTITRLETIQHGIILTITTIINISPSCSWQPENAVLHQTKFNLNL